ncbi:MAG: LacI family DNA-binding transcriptional regulator [Bacteroidales bacterium]|nr:LacI family DNA-binding transcriptional regulator [Bacteroidales bacterium]
MKETLTSISERIGVSPATISRIVNGKADKYRISKETVDKVMAEVNRCKYTPSLLARSLRTNKTSTIGLLLPSAANPFFSHIAESIIKDAYAKGYITITLDNMENEAVQRACLSIMISRKVDGIIAAPCGNDPTPFEEINRTTTPIVLVDRYFEESTLSHVTSNNYKGAFEATSFLIQNGHRHIACIQGDTQSMPNKRRVNGFLAALKESGEEHKAVVAGDAFSVQNGYLETKLILNMNPRPTAIFALSYTILLGVIKAVQDSGLHIPDDISVISFDENISLDYMTPPITRVSQPVEEMGKLASKLLFSSIENNTRKTNKLELVTTIKAGQSIRHI